MKEINEVPKVKVAGLDNEQSELLRKMPVIKSDVVVISGQNSAGKTQDLAEAANMLKLKEALEKQASNLNKLYSQGSLDIRTEVIGPLNFRKEAELELEIIKRLDLPISELEDYMSKGATAISDFKAASLELLDKNDPDVDVKKISMTLGKIGEFLKNNSDKIRYISTYSPFSCTAYLVGIKDNQMIALSNTYTE